MATPHPVVSIGVPVYNTERFIAGALDSLLAQSYPNYELLVMDDASTDSTPEIIASVGGLLTVVRQEQNVGQFANVNAGIARARAKWHST